VFEFNLINSDLFNNICTFSSSFCACYHFRLLPRYWSSLHRRRHFLILGFTPYAIRSVQQLFL
jgi:hypothetical protein